MRDFIKFGFFRSVPESAETIENKTMEKKLTDKGLRRRKFEKNTQEENRKRMEVEKTMAYVSKKEIESRLKYQLFINYFQTAKDHKNISSDMFLQEYDKIIDEIIESVSFKDIEALRDNYKFQTDVEHTKNELRKYKNLSNSKSDKDKKNAIKNLKNNFKNISGFLKTLLTSHWITVFKTLDDWKPAEEIAVEIMKTWNEIPD